MSEWISVEERLPQEWETVLVWSDCKFVECAVYIGIPGKWRVAWNHELMEPDTITHWMPLPEPPKEDVCCADCKLPEASKGWILNRWLKEE